MLVKILCVIMVAVGVAVAVLGLTHAEPAYCFVGVILGVYARTLMILFSPIRYAIRLGPPCRGCSDHFCHCHDARCEP
jgi:hypothetical protein